MVAALSEPTGEPSTDAPRTWDVDVVNGLSRAMLELVRQAMARTGSWLSGSVDPPSRGHPQDAPDGVIVLGGVIAEDVSAARGATALNESAERVTVAVELARRYPKLRIIFSGGTNALIFDKERGGGVRGPAVGGFGGPA